jgi:hypothetical protein
MTKQVLPLTQHHHQIRIMQPVSFQLLQMLMVTIMLMVGVQDYLLTQQLSSTHGPLEALSHTLVVSNYSHLQLV